ncbi:MAG: type II toxin-antitoxin system HicB family antitoxin [Pseudomonadota bacterium]|uniref:Type II toxin-antitoxin system HicB family antitoxin n=1 Tax=Candidatus Desulfatibia profunda TaxID=2841695 RepID=A0A8J6NQN5_9BACT|nr:type II toxin-antitoxin system HicB family antitoxin [Candidatus Desulfatibia profunda]MBL7180962.1 type II toxin-antitoxin system HicB family antitoxin [Desulfobacterales bacterium]MBU0699664.1 type II toxin-antitoxin system HicB family antitoxin [Pseudomonadota bacterium]
MDINITIEVWQKGKWFIAKCPELDFISQGKTREEAKNNLLEVIQIQFEEMSQIGALDEYLTECGYEKQNNKIIPKTEMIGFEKYSLRVA